ncbi:xanthine dehydrogenase molybdopterin-binding subunit B [Paraburkholderia sp. JPY162]|uniref:Xanthine dehydrogenase molybdopterin-binding subunit B n=1 Tax=Paraburkholderia youngii TaxID=2782701 RepID=A0A7W8P6Q0_9BURK|nr:xanthine dehydrogenase molybdopterin-binding subunit B [Paraburkholderia youngii]
MTIDIAGQATRFLQLNSLRHAKRTECEDTATLIKKGVLCVAEGANMPSTNDAAKCFESNGVLYAMRISWPR